MAISMKPDPDKGWQTMALFDVDHGLISQAKKHGLQCVQTSPGTYVVKSAVQNFGNILIKGTALTLAQQKALGPTSKLAFKTQFEDALKKGIAASPTKVSDTANEAFKSAEATMAKAFPIEQPEVKMQPKSAWPGLEPAKPVSPVHYDPASKPAVVTGIKLADATMVYQPVAGTTQGSTYYVFAMFPGLNLAARIKGQKLSVRAEGNQLVNYKTQLINDFKMDNGNGYVSAHYLVNEGAPLIMKTLAAIVGVIGFEKATKVADLKQFIGSAS